MDFQKQTLSEWIKRKSMTCDEVEKTTEIRQAIEILGKFSLFKESGETGSIVLRVSSLLEMDFKNQKSLHETNENCKHFSKSSGKRNYLKIPNMVNRNMIVYVLYLYRHFEDG